MIADRAAPSTLVPAARAMYEQGKTRSEVLAAIYGVDLPTETILFERELVNVRRRALRVLWTVNPWELMIPLERGGPEFMIGPINAENDAHAYAQAPHVLLVGWLAYSKRRVPIGNALIGYDLREVPAELS